MDQAQKLREMAQKAKIKDVSIVSDALKQQNSKAHVISVTSGKGGVGKSMFVTNLALSLARMKKRVVVVDADFGLANLDVMFNAYSRFNLSHVIDGKANIHECISDGPYGIRLISGGSGMTKLANLTPKQRSRLIECFTELEADADFVIIDTGAGIARNTVSVVLAAHEIVVVTTPEPTAVTDAYAMIKVIASQNSLAKVKLLVNMAFTKEEADRISSKMCAVSRQFLNFYLESGGYLLRDDLATKSIRDRKPVVQFSPNSRLARNILDVAATFCRDSQFRFNKPDRRGFIGSLAELLKGPACL